MPNPSTEKFLIRDVLDALLVHLDNLSQFSGVQRQLRSTLSAENVPDKILEAMETSKGSRIVEAAKVILKKQAAHRSTLQRRLNSSIARENEVSLAQPVPNESAMYALESCTPFFPFLSRR